MCGEVNIWAIHGPKLNLYKIFDTCEMIAKNMSLILKGHVGFAKCLSAYKRQYHRRMHEVIRARILLVQWLRLLLECMTDVYPCHKGRPRWKKVILWKREHLKNIFEENRRNIFKWMFKSSKRICDAALPAKIENGPTQIFSSNSELYQRKYIHAQISFMNY